MSVAQNFSEESFRLPKGNPKIKYVVRSQERDDAYIPVIRLRKKGKIKAFIKDSWIKGKDREAAFINALRGLYRTLDFPTIDGPSSESNERLATDEPKSTTRRLVGLPDFGPRTHVEYCSFITRDGMEPKKRARTKQAIYNKIGTLYQSNSPRHLCEVLRDAMLGLLNVYRMGYIHRDISPECIAFDFENQNGFMLSGDGKSIEGEPRSFKGFILDFYCSKDINEGTEQTVDDSEEVELSVSTPTPVLGFTRRSDYVHLPTFDLESFVWLLLSVASEIVTSYFTGIQKVRLDDPSYRAAKARQKADAARHDADSSDNPGPYKADFEESEQKQTLWNADSCGSEVENTPQAAIPDRQSKWTGDLKGSGDTDVHGSEVNDQLDQSGHRDLGSSGDELKTVEGKDGTDPDTDESFAGPDSDDGLSVSFSPHVWYFKVLSPGIMINILGPAEFYRPRNVEPPKKEPEYVAFQEDRVAYVIKMLLEPRQSETVMFTARPFRLHFVQKFEYFLSRSPGMRPFYPLAMELIHLNSCLLFPAEDVIRGKQEYIRDEVEGLFESYLEAFERYMPKEESWFYLDEYEGSDVQYKYYRKQFLGAFASPTNYKPSLSDPTL